MPRWPPLKVQSRPPRADKGHVEHAGQYLTFRVARLDFAIDSTRLRGILPAHDLEPVAPSHQLSRMFGSEICGFASMRGRDIPIVDLRSRLNLPHGTHGRTPCIVVVEVGAADGTRLIGFLADRVTKVIRARERDFLHGNLRVAGRTLRVLDPDVLFALGNPPAKTTL